MAPTTDTAPAEGVAFTKLKGHVCATPNLKFQVRLMETVQSLTNRLRGVALVEK